MRNKILLYFLIALCLCCVDLASQTGFEMDYNSFLENVLTKNPLSQKGQNLKSYGKTQLKAAKGSYDPQISGSYNSKYFAGSNYFSIINAELKQPLFANQYVKAGYDLGTGIRVNPEQITPLNGIPFLGLEVGLLQGFAIDKRRADLLKAREYKGYFEAEGEVQINELLFASSKAYITWLFMLDQAKVNRYFLEASTLRYNGIRELALAGERASIDTIEAGMQIQSRLMEYQTTLLRTREETNNISYILANNNFQNTDIEFRNSDSLDIYYDRCRKELANLVGLEFSSNPSLKKYASFQKVLAVEARYRKELIKPQLNVTYNFLAAQINASEFAFSPNNYKWGLNLSFPLFLRNPYNEYKLSRLDLDNAGLELNNKQNEIRAKINALIKNISVLQQQLSAAELNVKLSQDMLEAEKTKFSIGESSLFLLNTRENKLLEAELKLLESKAKFVHHILAIRFLNGDLNYKL